LRGKLYLVALALFTIAGCSSKETTSNVNPASASPSTNTTSATQPVKSKIDACSLLTSDDLKNVQGEAYTNAQRSDRQDGDFIVAQCYFAMPTTANSVVLNVTTARDGVSTTPRKFWEGTFAHRSEKPEREKDEKERAKSKDKAKTGAGEEREREEESPRPEKITGLGEDAYWLASSVGGALYVLKGEEFFRISVGGAGDAKSKLAKSKMLAEKVLKKL